ncbi:MAG: efflux RND transporter permease subunit [Bacteroidota bacterium]|nr:efflux RND transporter permease subunit [Bacteroidota bacterium]
MNTQNENIPNKVDKQFPLTTLSLKNSVSVFFLTFIIIVMGVLTYQSLPKDSYPEIKQPIVYIGTPYPGNSPVDMENLVTRQIEKELNSISEVDKVTSNSVQDYSTIIVEFSPETPVETALSKVKDAVDRAKPELPTDLPSDPNVFELDFSEFPIMNINLSGNFNNEELKEYAEYLEEKFEALKEVSKVDIRGLGKREVKIKVNPYELEARMVSYSDIETAIQGENVTISGGNILDNDVRRAIRIVGEFTDPQHLADVIIKHEKGNIVYLSDIATIEFDYKDPVSYARLYEEPVVMLDVVKRSGENLLIATEKIHKILNQAKAERFPASLNVSITNDQSSFTKEMVSSMENNIISGVIVVVIVLLLFIGTRNALFVGMAIPMSMFMTFIILGALGMTINMMVLFGLIMALGMLVDNGIVVVENVYRLREEGYSLWNATRLGVGEVALPIISSTATTLAAFLPLAMWPGLEGEFMKILPITLIVALTSSLFVALVINPVFIARYMNVRNEEGTNKKKLIRDAVILLVIGIIFIFLKIYWVGNLVILFSILMVLNYFLLRPLSDVFQSSFLPWLERLYNRIINFALRGKNPVFIFIGTFLLLIFSFVLMAIFPPNVLYFPDNEPKYVNVFIEFPNGTDIEATDRFTKLLEKKVVAIVEPYSKAVESVIANVGEGTGDPNDMSSIGNSETPHKARITVNFVDFKYREGISTTKIMDELREGISGNPGVSVTVAKNVDGPPAGKAVTIEVIGDDIFTLVDIAENMKTYINESDVVGIEKLNHDIETGKPELIVDLDREKARRFGLSTYSVANEIRTSLFGKEISKYKEGEDDYEIQLRMDDKYRYDMGALVNKSITFRDQSDGRIRQVPISSVASTQLSTTYGNIKRKDQKRIVTLTSNVLGGYNATVVNEDIKNALADFPMPSGYEFKFAGEQEKQSEQMAFLMRSLLLAIFVIFFIIVAQFNKFTAPLIIMTSVLFSTTGVFLGLIIFQMDFVIMMTMVGIISLAGIVVNNSIVLIDFIELKRRRLAEETGRTDQSIAEIMVAIKEAGKTRLRPVLLTAITTVLGLIPLAVGINIDFIKFFTSYNADFYLGGDSVMFWAPLAWTIIFGLIFATFLTLIVVPVMYLLSEKGMLWIGRKTGVNLKMSAQPSED